MTGGEPPPFLVVGHVVRPHGTRGEVFVWPLTDHPGTHFVVGARHLLADEVDGEGPTDSQEHELESVREHARGFLARFAGVGDRDAAEALRGRYLFRRFTDIDELDEGEIFYHELVGAEVVTADGSPLGSVREVFPLAPSELLEVVGPRGDFLLPLHSRFVRFDRERRRLVADPPEGILP
ncbi:MAG: ribosome maturation factor RimM [Gemmatimonadetes bacterium]|nr:ribosome maturation factor RimM [Gemmatimonadota bacterium]MCY3942479.1 ribosome maturation factor RimM [Gemmatimonadota bacterium]